MKLLFSILIAFISSSPFLAMADWESYKGNEGDYRLVADAGGNSGIAFVCYDNRLFLSLMQAKVSTQRPTKPIPVFLSISVDGGSEKLFDAYLMGFDDGIVSANTQGKEKEIKLVVNAMKNAKEKILVGIRVKESNHWAYVSANTKDLKSSVDYFLSSDCLNRI
ncbi:Uncharacterised protein [Serratia quinivorans]|uniref:hypothetical protein n=1 Tax=Serratia quinivorans TaxID=137545 RepID=UPI00217804CF|nr:hypothetical protein [Serratia quinivorans]CAI2057258.1 Uncharacterised protein [Serratia quinivorans]